MGWKMGYIYIYILPICSTIFYPVNDMIWLINVIHTNHWNSIPKFQGTFKHSKTIVTNRSVSVLFFKTKSRKSSPLEPLIHRPWNPHLPRRNTVFSSTKRELEWVRLLANHGKPSVTWRRGRSLQPELNRDFDVSFGGFKYWFTKFTRNVVLEGMYRWLLIS